MKKIKEKSGNISKPSQTNNVVIAIKEQVAVIAFSNHQDIINKVVDDDAV